jgi:glycosyltransferase involved in cell wall biosynthesis
MTMRSTILLLIPHLGGGGAEQVTALWARSLSRERYDVHLGLVTQADCGSMGLPEWVTVHGLGARRVRSSAWSLLRLIRRLRPSLIVSGMAHLNFLVLLLRPLFPRATRVLVRQNSTVSSALAFGDLPRGTRLLYRLLYPFADGVICQTESMAADLVRETGIPPHRIAVVPNPLDVDAIRSEAGQSQWTGAGPHLLAVGRLAPVKGFDLLLRALAQVRRHFPRTDLVIAGVGPEEAALRALSGDLGLSEAVRFAGYVRRPAMYFPGATAFVLSSRHEGLPNALLEAAAAGLPIVALPSSGGVVDLLRGQPGIWLAPEISAESLAADLHAALEVLRPNQRFQHVFIEPYQLNRAMTVVQSLIDRTLKVRP